MKGQFLNSHTLTRLALLTALAVVLTRLGSVEFLRAGLEPLPIIMAGVYYGPVAGGMVGAVADITGFSVWPMGPYAPHFTLTSMLTGVIPALVVAFAGRRNLRTLLVAVALGQAITAIYLVPLFLEQLFQIPRAVTVPPRTVTQMIQLPVYVAILRLLEGRMPAAILRAVPARAHSR